MKMISNVHTHSSWCDGNNTIREMIERAIALGFSDIGFSSHSSFPTDPSCPGLTDACAYTREIADMQKEFHDRIQILCGLELDAYSRDPQCRYDYRIGSLHYVKAQDGSLISVDDTPQGLSSGIDRCYAGNALALVSDFYVQTVQSAVRRKPEIIGHFDLVTKYNQQGFFFDENADDYRQIALQALDRVLDILDTYGGMVEINTGAIMRGYRDLPYPAPFLLERLAQRKTRMIITSDAHSTDGLDFGFERALKSLRTAGFSSMVVLRDRQFVDVAI